ncbi:hypothetical protein EIP91_006717 [Steccherinum ochraceum]|uniref:Uncharacterized protein n=1 Tax=Steccherinum ochraceum TaxID=92696 RepID=A0A4V2MVI4_9APHY|nr:hypothetical protein EIP91_006717 [Steccherinum ochraceum]
MSTTEELLIISLCEELRLILSTIDTGLCISNVREILEPCMASLSRVIEATVQKCKDIQSDIASWAIKTRSTAAVRVLFERRAAYKLRCAQAIAECQKRLQFWESAVFEIWQIQARLEIMLNASTPNTTRIRSEHILNLVFELVSQMSPHVPATLRQEQEGLCSHDASR